MTVNFKMAELFCGPGGLALGAEYASKLMTSHKISSIWANDVDPDTCETYANNIYKGDTDRVYCCPVQDLNFDHLKDFDGLSFGFPCNDYSLVGEQKGTNGKFGPLYKFGVKAINSKNPLWFVAENVSGLQSANEGKAFKKILKELCSAGQGYDLNIHMYKFEEYGVPQRRHRIIIVGIRKDLNLEYKVPAPTTPHHSQYKTSREALCTPPITDSMKHHVFTKQSPAVIQRLKHIPAGKNAWYEGIPKEYQLNVKGAKLSQIYKRLDPNKPSYTITGSGGGGTHGYHWSEPRALTNRERARIQTFPDKYIFSGSKESIRKQIGMAVPPEGAKHIFLALLKTFAGIDYKYVQPKYDIDEIMSQTLVA